MLMALAFKRCMEGAWGTKATDDGFARYDFTSEEVSGLKKESVQVSRRAAAVGVVPRL